MNNPPPPNDADELFALRFALESAKETISEILASLENKPNTPITKLRQRMRDSLTDFANIILVQGKTLNAQKNEFAAPINPRFAQTLNLPMFSSIPNYPSPFLDPSTFRRNRIIPKNQELKPNKRLRKQNLFDEDKLNIFDLSSENNSQEDEEKPDTKQKETRDDIIPIANDKNTKVKGDLQATTDFLDEYRNKTKFESSENCPEKFTVNQLDKLGSTPYKKTNFEVIEECEMCCQEYVENEKVSFLTCHHKFHTVCIKDWLTKKNECPVCGLKACLDFNI